MACQGWLMKENGRNSVFTFGNLMNAVGLSVAILKSPCFHRQPSVVILGGNAGVFAGASSRIAGGTGIGKQTASTQYRRAVTERHVEEVS